MASVPPPGLDGPPPNPVNQPPPGPQIIPAKPESGPMAGGEPGAQDKMQTVTKLGAELDRGLTVLASILPEVAPELRAAKQALMAALAKAGKGMTSPGQAAPPSTSPIATGGQFPGSTSPPKF